MVEACGWKLNHCKHHGCDTWHSPEGICADGNELCVTPKFDLNFMHEAEKLLDGVNQNGVGQTEWERYLHNLVVITPSWAARKETVSKPDVTENLRRPSRPLKQVVGTLGEYCKTVQEAVEHGWVKPYEGGLAADGWKGRIYGRRPGNHRIFRCTKRPNRWIHSSKRHRSPASWSIP